MYLILAIYKNKEGLTDIKWLNDGDELKLWLEGFTTETLSTCLMIKDCKDITKDIELYLLNKEN